MNLYSIKILFFLLLILTSCSLNNKVKKKSNKYSFEQTIQNEIDLLKSKEVDTLLVYINGCTGCVDGTPQFAYLFWTPNNYEKVIKKIDNKKVYSEVKYNNSVIEYFFNNQESIEDEKIEIANENEQLIHNNFSRIIVYYPKEKKSLEISNIDYELNKTSCKKIIVLYHLIESTLFEIEKNDMYWQR